MTKSISNTRGMVSRMRWCAGAAAIALLSSAILCSAAFAGTPDQSGFSAIQGVKAQALSVQEMQTISGQLNAYDIAAFLTAEAAKLAKYPQLQAADLKLAAWYTANANAINAVFTKLGIYTPCKSCGH